MRIGLFPRKKRPVSSRQRTSAAQHRVATVESLEQRVLLTLIGAHELEVLGRADDGTWWATGFDWDDGTIRQSDEIFANWNPAANWTDVLRGDFDGDGLDDVIGRDPDSGYWWASLADGTGSTTLLAVAWSNLTTWSDVAVVDLPNPKVYAAERGAGGLASATDDYADLIGRAGDGTWWAALANGDGTFTNVMLTQWNPAADWRDVLYFDYNRDGATDIIGRASDGSWWVAQSSITSDGSVTYTNTNFASWNEAAGWQDVMYAPGFSAVSSTQSLVFRYGAIVGRTSTGQWWAMGDQNGYVPAYVGSWNEAADWRDVGILLAGPLAADSIVGRTSDGEWFQSTFGGRRLSSSLIGQWDESAGWRDVQTVRFEMENSVNPPNGIVGRNSAGEWHLLTTRFSNVSPWPFQDVRLGRWHEAANWNDVQVGQFTRAAVTYGYYTEFTSGPFNPTITGFRASIFAQRTGVDVLVQSSIDVPYALVVTYRVPTTGYEQIFNIPPSSTQGLPTRLTFYGHIGADRLVHRATSTSITAYGRAGDDLVDAVNGQDFDRLFGGPGLDVLLGDPGDTMVQ